MNYLEKINDEETKYVCEAIPSDELKDYLRKNPKEFAKLMPGFRPTSIKADQTASILLRFQKKPFIRSFIEKHIDLWIRSIKDNIEQCKKDGDSEYQALLHTFPDCYFANNISLYFKLSDSAIEQSVLSILSEAVQVILKQRDDSPKGIDVEKISERMKESERLINEKEAEIRKLKKNIAGKDKNLSKHSETVEKQEVIIAELRDNLKKREKETETAEKEKLKLKHACEEVEKESKAIKRENESLHEKNNVLDNALNTANLQIEGLEKKYADENYEIAGDSSLVRPVSKSQFKEFLSYNLEDIGLSTEKAEGQLLVDHLTRILFLGYPIITNSITARNIASCVSNSITGLSNFKSLSYVEHIKAKHIVHFLNDSGRVVCLDGFLGNYNEIELFEILRQYKNKIIFLSVTYEKTLKYVPVEVLTYCEYLNVLRFPEMAVVHKIGEDPALLEEEKYELDDYFLDERTLKLTRQILEELGFGNQVIIKYLSQITGEEDLNQALIYSILPYIYDVKQENPYMLSKRLEKYAGERGRAPYKDIILRWFGINE